MVVPVKTACRLGLDVAIRCRNSIGWSEFSNPINSITTTSKDENHDKRRKRFLYRIGHIEQSIQSLEAARQKLPAEQVLLARNMSRIQDRIDELDSEIERVTSHVGNDLLSSHLLHGAEQVRDCVFAAVTCISYPLTTTNIMLTLISNHSHLRKQL